MHEGQHFILAFDLAFVSRANWPLLGPGLGILGNSAKEASGRNIDTTGATTSPRQSDG
jgi:hypothetical protein